MARNTDTGLRYYCGTCAAWYDKVARAKHEQKWRIVHSFPSKTGGPCKGCDAYIERGEYTYVLDSGIRKGERV